MVLYLAGLKAIPQDLYDAAAVDGAEDVWSRFRLVTWPMLGPATMFVVVITAIHAFKVFDTIAVLTQGGPQYQTEVLLWTIYKEAFNFFRTSYAAAMTLVFLFIIFGLTLLQVKVMEKRIHYT
ncbi:sugar ABC transporter permease, partial [candidate division KSB1 bacterium]|nr:sugar ABC transporter permease [candidate division KSB1 bacterium]NIW68558.1 ABC transporter permease subunit [candidate division KSB1 bacterium]NIX70165.1 ABC transporter permease subunit [candidate division KSB1 bacterium]